MPVLDSFKVDHTIMTAPSVRVAKTMHGPKGDTITIYDLRFCIPNKKTMSPKGIHTLEHLFAGFIRNHLNSRSVEIIDVSPMGCRTGFYMSLLGKPTTKKVAEAWSAAMQDVLNVTSKKNIPELNKYQCGTYKMHSLKGAKRIAKRVLNSGIEVTDSRKINLCDNKMKELGLSC